MGFFLELDSQSLSSESSLSAETDWAFHYCQHLGPSIVIGWVVHSRFISWVSLSQLGFLSLIVCVSVGRLGFLLVFGVPFSSITAMDQTVVEGLLNLRLTKEEEEEISIKSRCKSDLLEECSLSLFGCLLAERNQNQRALKNTMRAAWKMGSDLQIVDVGNNVLQFKFGSEY